MDYRRIVIRVIYASISIAVIAGVLTLFLPSGNHVIGRLLGTAISTAIAAVLFLVALRAHESLMTRPLGIALGILVSGINISIVFGIWLNLIRQYPIIANLEHQFDLTAMFLTMSGMPILLGAACIPHKRGNIAGKVFLGIWLVVLLSWLLDTWVSVSFLQYNVEYFTVPLMAFSSMALCVLIARNTKIRLVGIVLVILGCVALQIGASISDGHLKNSPILLDTGLFLGWASASLGLWNLITFRKEEFAIPWCERVAIILSTIALGSASIVIWSEINDLPLDDLLGRISASSGILSSAAVLTIFVSQIVRSLINVDINGSELQATCPRCLRQIVLPQGKSVCPFCSLHIKLSIESPGCRKCGYDLTGSIESNCCPECGELLVMSGNSS